MAARHEYGSPNEFPSRSPTCLWWRDALELLAIITAVADHESMNIIIHAVSR